MAPAIASYSEFHVAGDDGQAIALFTWLFDRGDLEPCDRCAEHRPRRVRLRFNRGKVRVALSLCGQCATDLVADGILAAFHGGRMASVAARLGLQIMPGPDQP